MKNLLLLFGCLCCTTATFSQEPQPPMQICHLTGNVYASVSHGEYKGSWVPANGLYIVTGKGIILINTPWSEDQTRQLADTLEQRYHQKITHCIVTHFHADCTAGLDFLKAQGVKTYSTQQTQDLCKERNEKAADFVFRKDTVFNINGVKLETFYPGEGHTKDNIVIWLPQTKVLYGGCFVKSMEATNMGFLGDGNLAAYPASLRKLKSKFPHPALLVPGHEGWEGGIEQVNHSLQLLAK
ncbi:MAG: subclass B1 metallo-beta-lactamase [Chitinophaga sp.]|uniref:subclass B1 metallo-beta-lactamase n=1 Tax=Chitinophaga sp. TaxID=1869181 RepID=UPI001B01FD94|nr:subclass B1 metallo-beta-lactamase [Chitinophaga sp.]MBO9731536.1 subclass B1 metallo-beta-lactamase [Chitinophaga sp.]